MGKFRNAGTSLCHVMSWQASPNVNLRDQREVVSLDLTIQRDEHWKSPESRTYINIVCKRASWLQSELIESSNCNNRQTVGWIWIQVVVFLSQDLPVLQLPSTILKSMQLPSATYQASVFWPQGATHDEVTPSTAYLAEALGVLFQGLQRISPNGWPPWQRWHRQREKMRM